MGCDTNRCLELSLHPSRNTLGVNHLGGEHLGEILEDLVNRGKKVGQTMIAHK